MQTAHCFDLISHMEVDYAQGVMEHETRALVLLSNDNGLLQDAELAWDVRGSPLRSFPWQVPGSQRSRSRTRCLTVC